MLGISQQPTYVAAKFALWVRPITEAHVMVIALDVNWPTIGVAVLVPRTIKEWALEPKNVRTKLSHSCLELRKHAVEKRFGIRRPIHWTRIQRR